MAPKKEKADCPDPTEMNQVGPEVTHLTEEGQTNTNEAIYNTATTASDTNGGIIQPFLTTESDVRKKEEERRNDGTQENERRDKENTKMSEDVILTCELIDDILGPEENTQ